MAVLDAGVDRKNLLAGRLRLLIAPVSVAIPAWFNDIHAMVSPYAKATGWLELGATTDDTTYELGMDEEDWFIQQSSQSVGQRITEIMRSITTTLGEITADNVTRAEEGGASTAIAAAANKGAGTRVRTGAIDARTPYRIALIGERDRSFGAVDVVEPGGLTRGALFGLVGHRAMIAAEDQEMEFDAEDLVGREIQYNLFPDDGITAANENTVSWFFEAPGTISAV